MIKSLTFGAFAALIGGQMAYADIQSAQYAGPTERYAHGVLGDAIEYDILEINVIKNGISNTIAIVPPNNNLFEDLAPRLADVDGDGDNEVVVIETNPDLGAALAIYDETGKIATTPHIGTRNRWLSPIGVADFDGDGSIDIAYIDRPHLAKTLRIWSYRDGDLVEIARASPLTNHKIGWDYITGGVRVCNGVPEMITASGDWSSIMATAFVDGKLTSKRIGKFTGDTSVKKALNGC